MPRRKKQLSPEIAVWTFRHRDLKHPVRIRFAEVDGHIECVRVEIGVDLDLLPNQPPAVARPLKEINASDLRIPLAGLIAEGKRHVAEDLREVLDKRFRGSSKSITEKTRRDARRLLRAAQNTDARRLPGRPKEWDEHRLALVALVYVRALEGADVGTRKAPTRAVAEWFGISPSAAAKAVAKARPEFLTRGKNKQPGGRLTRRAQAILQETGEMGT